MKLLVMPSSICEIKKTIDLCDAYLIGIKNLSVNNNLCIDISELDDICNVIGNKELFININKNMSNSDILYLKKIMNELNNYNVKGVFYYDVAVLNVYNSNEYNYDLVWASEHASTNYNTINYWYNFKVKYCLVSSDITLNEIINIKKNSSCKLIVSLFGYQPMFNSKRHIVKNYLDFFNLKDNSYINYIEKEGKVYPIIDNDNGTIVYTDYILNGINEFEILNSNNIDYCLLNSFNIDSDKFIDVLNIIKNGTNFEQISSMFPNLSDGFLYKETISKVKKDEKKS